MVRVCGKCSQAYDNELDTLACPHDRATASTSRPKTTNPRLRELFHQVWTKAVGQPNYDKKEWLELRELFDESGIYL